MLNAGDGAVFLGRQATERTVRNTKLSDSRVLAFATHGLVAGQVTGAAEQIARHWTRRCGPSWIAGARMGNAVTNDLFRPD